MINERHGTRCVFGGMDLVTTDEWRRILENMQELREYAQANELKYFQNYFAKEFDKVVARSYDTNPALVSWYFEDEGLKDEIIRKASELYYKWAQENHLPPITKTTPALNRMHFRQTIAKCKNQIQWTDRYFGVETLDFLMDGVDKENVKVVRILASLFQDGITKELHERFEAFRNEMKKKYRMPSFGHNKQGITL